MITQECLKANSPEQISPLLENMISIPFSNCSKIQSNTASMQQFKEKIDASTLTDKVICKCDFDQIKKLKEKAHKSFMQVIQIQNLYKQEIEQLEVQYQQREKTQLKKFQCKQNMLNQKCKELEQQLQKTRQYLEKEKQQKVYKGKILDEEALGFSLESPFIVQNIETIQSNCSDQFFQYNPNDSTDTLQNLQRFIPQEKLCQKHKIIKQNSQKISKQIETIIKQNNFLQKIKAVYQEIKMNFSSSSDLINSLIESVVNIQDQYNFLNKAKVQVQSRYSKLHALYEANQKQTKFMADHIRRISQDKIKIDKKLHQQQKNNRQLNQKINNLKKIINQHGIDSITVNDKNFDIQSQHVQVGQSPQQNQTTSIRLTQIHRSNHNIEKIDKKNIFMRMSIPAGSNKPHMMANFKKKITEKY